MRGSELRQTFVAKWSAFEQLHVCLVGFNGTWECGFIKTLHKHWTRTGSLFALLSISGGGGLCIVAATALQIFVGAAIKGRM